MSPTVTGVVGIIILLILLFSRMNIGAAMGIVGFAGFAYLIGLGPALGLLKTVPYETFASYNLSVIPLFMLMGAFALEAGLSKDLYKAVYSWIGHFRGGLAMATVGACGLFAAISGSSLATVTTMGTVALPEMKKYKYHESLAAGAVAAGGSMGILIPPSVILIIYGIITEQSIGRLFVAGFIPGMLEALFYMITIMVMTSINPALGPRGPRTSTKEKMAGLITTWEVIILFLIVIGGIYLGVFTPTEAAGVGAFGTFIISILRRRLNWETLKNSLFSTSKTTGMLFIILLGAMLLGYFFSVTRLPYNLSSWVAALEINRYYILILILAVMLFMGCIMDTMAIVLLTVPIFFPLMMDLGFDPIWFGIVVVRITEMGLITPPVGLNVFLLKGISDIPMGTIYRGIFPFLFADFCEVALLIAIPEITLFLPHLMY